VIAPLLWSGAIHGFMGILNPLMSEFVEWRWFVASQIAYGLACGAIIMRVEMVPVPQPQPRTHPTGPASSEPREGQS
jgi:hypothetical protein